MAKFTTKTHQATEQYIAAHKALSALNPAGSWTVHLQPLNILNDLHLLRWENDNGLDETEKEIWGRGAKFHSCKQSENQWELSWI